VRGFIGVGVLYAEEAAAVKVEPGMGGSAGAFKGEVVGGGGTVKILLTK